MENLSWNKQFELIGGKNSPVVVCKVGSTFFGGEVLFLKVDLELLLLIFGSFFKFYFCSFIFKTLKVVMVPL